MKLAAVLILFWAVSCGQAHAQSASFWKPNPAHYEVQHAVEVESLFPMFFTGGYHIGVGYRYKRWRIRLSVIDGGTYNVDGQAVGEVSDGYERYYTPSPGYFLGYNVWKNLEIYAYYERHTFDVKQLSTREERDILSNDVGIGISYQFFVGSIFYIQPGIHTYFRKEKELTFSNSGGYATPTFELTPIVRVGARLCRKFDH